MKAFINSVIYTGKEVLRNRILIVKEGKINSIVDPETDISGMEIIDCKGNNLASGLLDLQIAGGGGYLFSSSPTTSALEKITEALVSTGTTGFLITLPTNTPEVYRSSFKAVSNFRHQALLGIHLEGPYLNPVRKGAHLKEYLRIPDKKDIEALIEESEGTIKMMTVAPEVCDEDILEVLRNNNIVIAAGHSNATFVEANKGFSGGITTTTHLFNAMSQLHHRDPGLPGAVFQSDSVHSSIIADGIHVDYNMVVIAKKLMNERLFLVSDAVEENHTGAYQHVRQSDRFTLPDGTLSGSKLTMLSAAGNCIRHAGISIDEALRMASMYPAEVMNINDRGKIEPGCRADLIQFNNEMELQKVFIEGNLQ